LAHLTTALGVVFGMTILLLLLGTQILDWYWLPAVFLIGLGYGAWKVSQAAPTLYQVAQRVDRSLVLHDALSTALHFSTSAEPANQGVKQLQVQQAEEAARTVDLKAALPFTLPKTAYISGGLALIALTMFAVRYGVTQNLDFKPSLVAMAFDNFFTGSDTVAKNQGKGPLDPKKMQDEFEKLGMQVNAADQKMSDLDPGHENSNEVVDTPDVNADPGADAKSQSKLDPQQVKAQGDEASQDQEGSDQGKGQQSQPESGDGKNDQAKDAPEKAGEQKGDNSSLMDKLKDAMSNMLNKMKMQQKGNQQQQQQSASKDGSQSEKGQKSEQQAKNDQKGQQANGESKDQQQEGKDGQQGQKSENAQGKSAEQKGNQQQSADAKSGQGKQDGSKDLKDAELQQAVGKISEIFGKRQQNLTGEIMIEVSSGKQQLKTAYSSKTATHKESGGEINRDEVPLIYQQYVEKYFDQVRKADAAAEKAAAEAAKGRAPANSNTPAAPPPAAGQPRPTTGAAQ